MIKVAINYSQFVYSWLSGKQQATEKIGALVVGLPFTKTKYTSPVFPL